MSLPSTPQLGKDVLSCLAIKVDLGDTTDIPVEDLNIPQWLACSSQMS